MCSRWIADNGISRGTRINCRRSLIITSAARSIRLLLAPVAMAESEPEEQGQTTIERGAAEPLATGANHSCSPKTRNSFASVPKRWLKKSTTATGSCGSSISLSAFSTTRAAGEIIR